jgi:hypothetical protein
LHIPHHSLNYCKSNCNLLIVLFTVEKIQFDYFLGWENA